MAGDPTRSTSERLGYKSPDTMFDEIFNQIIRGSGGGNVLSGEGISPFDIAQGLGGGGGQGGSIPTGGFPEGDPLGPLQTPGAGPNLGGFPVTKATSGIGFGGTSLLGAGAAGGSMWDTIWDLINSPIGLGGIGTLLNLFGGGEPGQTEIDEEALEQARQLALAFSSDVAGRGPQTFEAPKAGQVPGVPFELGGGLTDQTVAGPQASALLALLQEILAKPGVNDRPDGSRPRGDEPPTGRARRRQPEGL